MTLGDDSERRGLRERQHRPEVDDYLHEAKLGDRPLLDTFDESDHATLATGPRPPSGLCLVPAGLG